MIYSQLISNFSVSQLLLSPDSAVGADGGHFVPILHGQEQEGDEPLSQQSSDIVTFLACIKKCTI